MGDGGREGEGQVDKTKHRKHQYISSRCPSPSSVAFVIGICSDTARILYWAGIHVTYYRWNPTLVTGCIVISRVISGNIAFGKGFSFVSISINIKSWGALPGARELLNLLVMVLRIDALGVAELVWVHMDANNLSGANTWQKFRTERLLSIKFI